MMTKSQSYPAPFERNKFERIIRPQGNCYLSFLKILLVFLGIKITLFLSHLSAFLANLQLQKFSRISYLHLFLNSKWHLQKDLIWTRSLRTNGKMAVSGLLRRQPLLRAFILKLPSHPLMRMITAQSQEDLLVGLQFFLPWKWKRSRVRGTPTAKKFEVLRRLLRLPFDLQRVLRLQRLLQ